MTTVYQINDIEVWDRQHGSKVFIDSWNIGIDADPPGHTPSRSFLVMAFQQLMMTDGLVVMRFTLPNDISKAIAP